ncbi:hypothetical protein GMSM_36690 [Geomonas sp. Red276]
MRCPLCLTGDPQEMWPVRDNPDYRVERCGHCGGRFLFPQPTDEFLRELYSRSYYDAWGLQEEDGRVREMKIATFGLRLELIKRYQRQGKVLDVGCATGFFLEEAARQGFTPFGVEFSPYSSRIAAEKFGEQAVFQGVLEDAPFAPGSFDVIAMSDLLEHVRNPGSVLAKSRELLKDDGVVMVMTPDTSSLTHRVMGSRWVHYKIEHLFYFDPRSLEILAKRHGFRVLHREAASKALTVDYFYHQFERYPHWLLTPVCRVLHRLLPKRIRQANFRITIGEMVVLLEKIPLPEGASLP